MPEAPTAAPPPTEPHWNAPSRGSEPSPPTPAPGVPVPVGAIGGALAALLLVALLRGTRLSIGLMAGSPDRSVWLMPVLAAAGAVVALGIWGRLPNRSGWLLAGAGALLLAPCAAVLASGTALTGTTWQQLIGVTAAPAGALLTVGVLATGRMLWLWGWNRSAAAVVAGTVLVQLIPAGLLDQQLGAALALESGPASTSGVVVPLADPAFAGGGSSARMAEGVLLLAAIVLVFAGGLLFCREQRLPGWEADRAVSGRLVAVGIAATVISVLPPVWLGVIALRPVPWSESGWHAAEQAVQLALLASGAVLLLTGVALLAAVGRSVAAAILLTAPGLALVGGIAPAMALGVRPSGMLFAAVVLGAAAGVVLATQRFSGVVAAALVVLFAAALIVSSQQDPSLDSGPDRRAALLLAGIVMGFTAIGAIVGSAVRRIAGAASTQRGGQGTAMAGAPSRSPHRVADEMVIGVGVLLPFLAGAGGTIVLGLAVGTGGSGNAGDWPVMAVVLVLLPLVAAALTLRTRPAGR